MSGSHTKSRWIQVRDGQVCIGGSRPRQHAACGAVFSNQRVVVGVRSQDISSAKVIHGRVNDLNLRKIGHERVRAKTSDGAKVESKKQKPEIRPSASA